MVDGALVSENWRSKGSSLVFGRSPAPQKSTGSTPRGVHLLLLLGVAKVSKSTHNTLHNILWLALVWFSIEDKNFQKEPIKPGLNPRNLLDL